MYVYIIIATRNPNSSRFGKFTKLYFHDAASPTNDPFLRPIAGAAIETYLLEKGRVSSTIDDMNYHILYYILAAKGI
jgi:myosin heavy subunit